MHNSIHWWTTASPGAYTAQKMKFSFKDFSSKCDQIRSFLWIWSHLMEPSLMKSFIFCAVVSKLAAKNHYSCCCKALDPRCL